MHPKARLIADIRFYENQGRTEYGAVRHASLGTLYPIPFRSFGAIGDRFACKLRERGFTLPGFDHIYVVFTPALPPGVIEPSTLTLDPRIRYVDVGLSPDQWNSLDDGAKHDQIVDLTSAAIGVLGGSGNVRDDVAAELKQFRSELEIIAKTKDASSYRVDVSFQIRPLQEQSIAFVTYTDKRTRQQGRTVLAKLVSANDVYPLCGEIVVQSGMITIRPRPSARATTFTKRYNTPLSVAVAAVLGTDNTEPGVGADSR